MARVRLALVLAFLVSATVCHNITLTNDQLDTYIKTCLTKTRISQERRREPQASERASKVLLSRLHVQKKRNRKSLYLLL
uniref:Uncharacterized protein n=1 Tax=Trichogramma kaykai TaxID=54128 RepID=A0ABD2WWX0_9HYME